MQDSEWLLRHLQQLTDQSEVGRAVPWKVSDAPPDYIRQLVKGIVGFELPIKRLEGKWKVSQNRTGADRRGVIEGLAELGTPAGDEMSKLVMEVEP